MTTFRLLLWAVALAAVGSATGCGEKDPSSLHIVNLRVEQPAPGDSPGLLFTVDNRLRSGDSLVSVTSPDAALVTVEDNDGRLRTGPDGPVALPAQEMTRFEPGAYRARLVDPVRLLDVGDQVRVTFSFGSGVRITLLAPVIAPGQPGPDEGHR